MPFDARPRSPVILYVEDDPMSREIMEFYLVNVMGWSQVHVFDSGKDLAARLHTLPAKPDVILLDIHMWPVDGFEVLASLREQEDFASIPVVAITASVMNEEIARMRRAGFSGCIAKPLDQTTFEHSLTQILDGEKIWQI